MREEGSFEKTPDSVPENPEKENIENIETKGPESPEDNLVGQPQEGEEKEKSLSDYIDIVEQQEKERKPRSRYGTTTGKPHFPRAPILSMRNVIRPKGIKHPLSSGTKFTGPGRKHHPRKTA